ncbi:MAG: DNA alkylation repair protein [Polyangiales bacterium]
MSEPTKKELDAFVRDVRSALKTAAVPEDAEPMRAYMKSEMPYWGVKKAARASATKPILAKLRKADVDDVVAYATALFHRAEKREERYVAQDLLRTHRKKLRARHLDVLEALVVAGPWWDHVDEIAAHLVGAVLQVEPDATRPRLLAWSTSDDLWLRRTAILAQLGFGAAVDRPLFEACMAPSLERKEFWLRKAIGWALRQLSRSDPAWVRAYVEAHPELSPLSKKEALRLLA